jgi:CotH kinase protein/Chitobiase/beta-hexosaminidase C-terminal domain/Lamin Tail Domain
MKILTSALLFFAACLTAPSARAMRINEILAVNEGGLQDADQTSPGWLELYNETAAAVNLSGWRLTDDPLVPAKWVFPSVSVPANGYLLVFTSGKNRTGAELHTNFQLDPDGEYLALSLPDGTVTDEFTPFYPKLRRNISYSKGALPGGSYHALPTPRALNAAAFTGFVADTKFGTNRGFFTAAQTVEITSLTPGAVIRYTLDGSAPTAATGTVYTTPVSITGTTVLRAAAFLTGWIPSNVDTHTYIFNAQTPLQSATQAGWPANWGYNQQVNDNDGALPGIVPANYGMDARVVNNTQPGYGMAEALAAVPSLSLVMAPADFLGAAGIYQNPTTRGLAWEKACSVELMDPAGLEPGFHETAKVEVHGNSSRTPWRMQKHSLRVTFSSDFGASKLGYPLYPGRAVREYNKFVLRGCFTDSWGLVSWTDSRYRPDDSVYFRDIWMRRSHTAMGALPVESRFVHLYINGLYWGIYNVTERFDEEHLAAHLGGLPTDYEVVNDFVDPDTSTTSRWKTFFNLMTAAGSLVTRTNYERVYPYVDLVDFADYYLLHVHAEAEDWPHHNGLAWRRKTGTDLRYRWGTWDQEIALDNHAIDRLSAAAVNTGTDRTPGRLYQRLRENPEFRMLMADRAHKLLRNGGPLSLANSQNRWQAAANEIDQAIVAESARWGDTAEETPYGNVPLKLFYTRQADWLPTVNNVRDVWLPYLHNETNVLSTIRKLKTALLFPPTDPPVFAQHGGYVTNGYVLPITATAGHSIYFTLDGTDPREAWTSNAIGTLYAGSVPLTQTATVIARARNGTLWSARTEALFIVGTAASAANIVISELHYNPLPPSTPAELAVASEGNDFEFIELANIAPGLAVDLTNIRFTVGIATTALSTQILQPGERGVFVKNAAAFNLRYGSQVPAPRVLGVFTGSLDNSGEQLILLAANNSEIRNFRYDDAPPWPTGADGGGPSLVLIAPMSDPVHGLDVNWRDSSSIGGSPGSNSYARWAAFHNITSPAADDDRDGLSNVMEYAMGTQPGTADTRPSSLAVLPDRAVEFTLRHATKDDLVFTPEASVNLGGWSPIAMSVINRIEHGDGTASTTWRSPVLAPGDTRYFFRVSIRAF